MTPADQALEFVRRFLGRTGDPIPEVTLDTDLFGQRLLSSLAFVEFLMQLEQATGREVLLDQVDPEQLRTPRSIAAAFFGGPTPAASTSPTHA